MKKNILFLLSTLACAHHTLYAACAFYEGESSSSSEEEEAAYAFETDSSPSESDEENDASALQELVRTTSKQYDPSTLRRAASAPDYIAKPKKLEVVMEEEEEVVPTRGPRSLTPAPQMVVPTPEELEATIENLKNSLRTDPYFEIQLYDEPIRSTLREILQKSYLDTVKSIQGYEPERSQAITTHLMQAVFTLTEALAQRDHLRMQALETFFATNPTHGSKRSFDNLKANVPSRFLTLPTLYHFLIATPQALAGKTSRPSRKQIVRADSAPATHTAILQDVFDQSFPEPASSGRSSNSIRFAHDNELEEIKTFVTDPGSINEPHPLFLAKIGKEMLHQELLDYFTAQNTDAQNIASLLDDGSTDDDDTAGQLAAATTNDDDDLPEEMRF